MNSILKPSLGFMLCQSSSDIITFSCHKLLCRAIGIWSASTSNPQNLVLSMLAGWYFYSLIYLKSSTANTEHSNDTFSICGWVSFWRLLLSLVISGRQMKTELILPQDHQWTVDFILPRPWSNICGSQKAQAKWAYGLVAGHAGFFRIFLHGGKRWCWMIANLWLVGGFVFLRLCDSRLKLT